MMGVDFVELGDRIRQLRKEKRMTQEELAGKKLSKGMLSLIENNKAKPSMESLAYIAEQLGVSVSELLQEENRKKLKSLLEKAEKIYFKDRTNVEETLDKYKKVGELIQPVLNELTESYESARLLELYSYSRFYSKQDRWEEPLKKAAEMYEALHVPTRRAAIGVFRSFAIFAKRDYEGALNVLLNEKKSFKEKEVYLDPVTRLEFDYTEVCFLLAIGDVKKALAVLEEAVEFSRNNKIFYRIDDLFRLAVGYGILFHDSGMLAYYNDRLIHYGKFAEDPFYEAFTALALAEKKMFQDGDYQGALRLMEKYGKEFPAISEPHFTVAKGKALYGLGKYEEAFSQLEKVTIPDNLHHPYDLSLLHIADTYKALCQWKLGNVEHALRYITLAKENFSTLTPTKYTELTEETYRKIVDAIKN